jgi:hypothetical protein
MIVWVDGWQLDCCGKPFRVGSRVSWTLRAGDVQWLADVLGLEVAASMDTAEEHHGGVARDTARTTVTVTRIAQVHYRADPDPVPGWGLIAEVAAAEKWVTDRGDKRFAGFLVGSDQDCHG